jgi:hypothetical protein
VEIRFDWGPNKSKSNQQKHGVSFEQGAQVFHDPYAVLRLDRIEDGEMRWHTIGQVDDLLLLLVVHTIREEGSVEFIRIISARRATPNERRRYEEENG